MKTYLLILLTTIVTITSCNQTKKKGPNALDTSPDKAGASKNKSKTDKKQIELKKDETSTLTDKTEVTPNSKTAPTDNDAILGDCTPPDEDKMSSDEILSFVKEYYGVDDLKDINDPIGLFGETLLHMVASSGSIRTAQILLDNKANINQPDSTGETPIFYAVRGRKPKMVSFLISQNADVTIKINVMPSVVHGEKQKPYYRNLLMYTASTGNKEIIDILVPHIDINWQNTHGFTALDDAISYYTKDDKGQAVDSIQLVDFFNYLINKGADINIRAPNNPPIFNIIWRKNLELFDLFITKGAKLDGIYDYKNDIIHAII